MVDSGSFCHAIDASTEIPDHEIILLSDNEKSQDGEAADGSIIKRLGRVKTQGTVDGKALNVTWNVMKVKVPILSVRRLVYDNHNVRFKKGGGYIRNLKTGEKIPFFEFQGVYFLKLKITPPVSTGSSVAANHQPVFIRPE